MNRNRYGKIALILLFWAVIGIAGVFAALYFINTPNAEQVQNLQEKQDSIPDNTRDESFQSYYNRPPSQRIYSNPMERILETDQLIEGINDKLRMSDIYNLDKKAPRNSSGSFYQIPYQRTNGKPGKRMLATENILDSPGIISFSSQDSSPQERYAYQHILTNLKEHNSRFIIYPFGFKYYPNNSEAETYSTYSRGAVFSLKPSLIPNITSSYNYFKSLTATSNVSFGKAKALYDINIAILKIEDYREDALVDLTYETTVYCNFLSSFLGKYTDCMTGSGYQAFKKDVRNAGKTALVMLNETDIGVTDLLFLPDGRIRFQLLIIPDFYLDSYAIIQKKLGTIGMKKISDFVKNGGIIYASGKAGYLLETWGLVDKNTFNTTKTLFSSNSDSVVTFKGCNNTGDDFLLSQLCMNVTAGSEISRSYLLSSFMMNQAYSENLTVLMQYDETSPQLFKKDLLSDGLVVALTDEEKAYLPYMVYKNISLGKIFIINGNPLYKSTFPVGFYNFLFMTMSKNIVFDSYIGTKDGKPIPGGEAGIKLDLSISFLNIYDTEISDLSIHVYFPNNLSAVSIPESCQSDDTNMSFVLDLSKVNISSHLKCGSALLDKFERYNAKIGLEILDAGVTQQKYDILMALAAINYTDKATGATYVYDVDPMKSDGALAALLRATLNPDPVGYFPLKGKGCYIDNVLQVENKEDTLAIDVEYIGIVPSVTPILDNNDQQELARMMRFVPSYYTTPTPPYWYPMEDTTDKNIDYIDFMWLKGRNVILNADWDTPVKAGKKIRDPALFPPASEVGSLDIGNRNYTTTIDNVNYVLEQIYYINADIFFEHATARLLVFVDTAQEGGAKTLYPNGIPEKEKNPNKPTTCKREIAFARNDLFFYTSSQYQMPENINSTHVINIDRYPKYPGECVATFGDARSVKMVSGHFTILQPDGIKENEWSNEILMYCDKKNISLDQVQELSNNSIVLIHYLVPVKDPEVKRADDIMDFVANADGSGYLDGYPEIKFIYGHMFYYDIPGSISRQGGRAEIILPEGVSFPTEDNYDPVKNYSINYEADQVGFYKTTYDPATRTITAYFKRGLMPNEAYGKPSHIGFMIERLNSDVDILNVQLKLFEMKYDLSAPELNFERYMPRIDTTVTLSRTRFYSLPALEVHVKMHRKNETTIYPYELMEPYTRFGVYQQEIMRHRTIWVSAESHHPSEPALTTINGAYALLSNLGISSIPFVEYVTTGKSQLIPGVSSTSRIEWSDIWGRRWSQPLRTTVPDVTPLPGPVKNFMMSTTFEVTKTGTSERVLEWNSDETLDIRVHVKLLNNYQKYFDITICKDNEVPFFQKTDVDIMAMIYDSPPYSFQITAAQAPNNSHHINFGNRAVYGMCYDSEGTVLKGINVSAEDRATISTAYLCADTLSPTEVLKCIDKFKNLPTVSKRTNNNPIWWNYSPDVDKYYPVNYIKPKMWDMTNVDYDDNPFVKSHPYHMDNTLPEADLMPGNPPREKPHNLIAQPIFKGFGYSITYSKTKKLKKFPQYSGWWSDNLQNKDRTLLAGQSATNDISVDKATLLPASAWINIKSLIGPYTANIVNSRLKNIHTCLFNQHRVKVLIGGQRYYYLANVVQNNIIPIIPDLDKNDPRLTNFDCTNIYQYNEYNISMVDNVLVTPTIRDWLYFSANLRGHALETINIPMTLSPFSGIKYEGFTKVQDGGRFVYWNPCCGPNAFLVVDNPVNVIAAIRSDLTIDLEVFPKFTTTFRPVLYHLFKIADPAEIRRQWTSESYINHYGFGDSVVSVFVGGAQATKVITPPGAYTIVKITFYNNAGFDWNMKYGGMEYIEMPPQPLNADALMYHYKHSIKKPTAYNFLIYNIPDNLKPFITITPADHVLDVAPQFFDFLNINVVQIRDGYKADYYLNISLADVVPTSLQGKLHEIGISINETYFDQLPSYNDPTQKGYHDYHLQVPSVKIGIPYMSGTDKGKVFYTSGYSKNLVITSVLPKYWNIESAKLVSDKEIDNVREASSHTDTYKINLDKVWNEISETPNMIVNSTAISGTETNLLSINLTNVFSSFPVKDGDNPDIAQFSILLRVNSSQLEAGTRQVISNSWIYYTDFRNVTKSEDIPAPNYRNVESRGAWLKVSYTYSIVVPNGKGGYTASPDQRMFMDDADFTVKTRLTVSNTGNEIAYFVNMSAVLGENIVVLTEQLRNTLNYSVVPTEKTSAIYLYPSAKIPPTEPYSEEVYLRYHKSSSRRLLADYPSTLNFISSASADVDLVATPGIDRVSQTIQQKLAFSLLQRLRDQVTLESGVSDPHAKPIVHLVATATPTLTLKKNKVRFKFYKKLTNLACISDSKNMVTGNCANIIQNTEAVLGSISDKNIIDDTVVPTSFTGQVVYGVYTYRVETLDESKAILAKASVVFEFRYEVNTPSPTPQPTPTPTPIPVPSPEPYPIPEPLPDNQEEEANSSIPVINNSRKVLDLGGLPPWAAALVGVSGVALLVVISMFLYRKYHFSKIVPQDTTVKDDIRSP